MGKEFNDSNISESVNDDERNKVVYLHLRKDDGRPFYIGIGSLNRAYSVHSRNIFWRRVYEKHGRVVEILHENLTYDEACAIEIKLIAEYRSKYPHSMTNISSGGETGPGLSGQDNGQFKGHVLLLSLCGRYFLICSGKDELEKSGFHSSHVYSLINGTNKRESVSSKKIHINRKKIRFKALRFNDTNEITDDMLENRVEAKISNDVIVGKAGENCYMFGRTGELNPLFGRTGESSNNFKGYSLGVSQTHFVLLAGEKEMKSKNFHSGPISSAISGRYKSYRGFIWSRIDENFNRDSLLTLRELIPYDEDSESRLNQLLNE